MMLIDIKYGVHKMKYIVSQCNTEVRDPTSIANIALLPSRLDMLSLGHSLDLEVRTLS